jgi:hypothetical protein
MTRPLDTHECSSFARGLLMRLVEFGDRSFRHFERRYPGDPEGDPADALRKWRHGVVSAGIAYAMAMARAEPDTAPAALPEAFRETLREWLALDGENVPEDLDWVANAAAFRLRGEEGGRSDHGLLLGTLPLANVLGRSVRSAEGDLARELGDAIAGFVPRAWEDALERVVARRTIFRRLGCAPASLVLLALLAALLALGRALP